MKWGKVNNTWVIKWRLVLLWPKGRNIREKNKDEFRSQEAALKSGDMPADTSVWGGGGGAGGGGGGGSTISVSSQRLQPVSWVSAAVWLMAGWPLRGRRSENRFIYRQNETLVSCQRNSTWPSSCCWISQFNPSVTETNFTKRRWWNCDESEALTSNIHLFSLFKDFFITIMISNSCRATAGRDW